MSSYLPVCQCDIYVGPILRYAERVIENFARYHYTRADSAPKLLQTHFLIEAPFWFPVKEAQICSTHRKVVTIFLFVSFQCFNLKTKEMSHRDLYLYFRSANCYWANERLRMIIINFFWCEQNELDGFDSAMLFEVLLYKWYHEKRMSVVQKFESTNPSLNLVLSQ